MPIADVPVQSHLAIKRITSEKLFGEFDYDLKAAATDASDFSNLLILYGDNGSGKTTILKLLFRMLSVETNRGHKSFLANQAFKRFSVTLADNTVVEAYRDGSHQPGDFFLRIAEPEKEPIVAKMLTEPRPSGRTKLRIQDDLGESYKMLVDKMSSLRPSFTLVTDDRRYLFSGVSEVRRMRIFQDTQMDAPLPSLETAVQQALSLAHDAIRTQAISGARSGEQNTNKIYTDLVKAVVRASEPRVALQDLVAALGELSEKSKNYSAFGLLPQFKIEDLVHAIQNAPEATRHTVCTVMEPYIESLRARLDALADLQECISAAIGYVNSFYKGKTLAFHMRTGFKVLTRDGYPLNPSLLSSGEKQLLLLFCTAIEARVNSGYLIVDEPEISLNVKWQRELLKALLTCVNKSRMQIIVASHSLDVVGPYVDRVLRLEQNRTLLPS